MSVFAFSLSKKPKKKLEVIGKLNQKHLKIILKEPEINCNPVGSTWKVNVKFCNGIF
jgi:hypothetical protein